MSPLALSLHFLQAQPDSRLVALARDGHEPAFEALVRRYRKELLSYCRRLQPRSGSAEDALQQSLLQAWRALKAGADVRDVRPWLYRIAHNVTLNQLRMAVAVPHEIPDGAGGQEVDQLVEQRLQARAALVGMASLPTLQRQAFMSTTLDGASHEDVATALGLSSGAVRGLVYRARATLRAAAAAVIPSPALGWAIRRAEIRGGGAPALAEALAGGGGVGVAAALAKGGAVLTLAGAVAGAGGVILANGDHHHGNAHARLAPFAHGGQARPRVAATAALVTGHGVMYDGGRHGAEAKSGAQDGRPDDRTGGDEQGGSRGGATGVREGGSPGGPDGGSVSGSSSGSDDGSSSSSTTVSSSGSSPGSPSGSSGSSGGSTSTTSGSDGGTTGGGPGPSIGGQTATADLGSGESSSLDGGSSGGSGSSGSGDTVTTSDGH